MSNTSAGRLEVASEIQPGVKRFTHADLAALLVMRMRESMPEENFFDTWQEAYVRPTENRNMPEPRRGWLQIVRNSFTQNGRLVHIDYERGQGGHIVTGDLYDQEATEWHIAQATPGRRYGHQLIDFALSAVPVEGRVRGAQLRDLPHLEVMMTPTLSDHLRLEAGQNEPLHALHELQERVEVLESLGGVSVTAAIAGR